MGQVVDRLWQGRFTDTWRNMTTAGKVMLLVLTVIGVVLIALPNFVGEAWLDSVLVNGGTAFLLLPPLYYGQERIAATSRRQQAIQEARDEKVEARRSKEQWTDQPAERLSWALDDAHWTRQADEDTFIVWSNEDHWLAFEVAYKTPDTDAEMVTDLTVSRLGVELGLTNAQIGDKAIERAQRDASALPSSHSNSGNAVALTDPSSKKGGIRRFIHFPRRMERSTAVTGSGAEDEKP
jgi:hypothetical protein